VTVTADDGKNQEKAYHGSQKRNEFTLAGFDGTTAFTLSKAASSDDTTTSSTTEDDRHSSPLFHMIFSTGDDTLTTLNLRSMESIFFHHPQARLILHTRQEGGITTIRDNPKLEPLLTHGYNISLRPYQTEVWLQAAMDVPGSLVDPKAAQSFLSRLYDNQLQQEKYWYSNETNLLRLCILYLQGGIYLDTDVILISDQLAAASVDNVMGRNSDHRKFHCAVMKFTEPGNPFLAAVLSDFLQNYNGTAWGHNGPQAYGRAAAANPELVCPDYEYDNGTPTTNHRNKEDCYLNPLPNQAFAPVSWKHWDDVCFRDEAPKGDEARKLIDISWAVHLNNRKTGSKLQEAAYQPGSLCDFVLSSFCELCLQV